MLILDRAFNVRTNPNRMGRYRSENGTIQISRSYVRGIYRVTKNRRRKRRIKLLEPAIQALKKQYQTTGNTRPKTIEVLQRDNKTKRIEKVRFVWINHERSNHFEYHELRYRWNKHLKKRRYVGVESIRVGIPLPASF
jgi:integrase